VELDTRRAIISGAQGSGLYIYSIGIIANIIENTIGINKNGELTTH